MIFIDGALILIPLYYRWNTFFMLDLLHNRNNNSSYRQIDQQNCFQQSHGLPVKVSLAWTRWVSVSLKKTYYYSRLPISVCLSVCLPVQLCAGSSENSHARLWNMLFAVWHQRWRLCGDVCLRSGHLRIPPGFPSEHSMYQAVGLESLSTCREHEVWKHSAAVAAAETCSWLK